MLNFVYDSTAVHAAHMLAATLLGQIMPNTQEYFELVPDGDDDDEIDDDTYKMFDRFNCTLPAMMAKPESRLYPSREEQLLDLGVFGIGSVCVDHCRLFITLPELNQDRFWRTSHPELPSCWEYALQLYHYLQCPSRRYHLTYLFYSFSSAEELKLSSIASIQTVPRIPLEDSKEVLWHSISVCCRSR